jgi:hypothetical protein
MAGSPCTTGVNAVAVCENCFVLSVQGLLPTLAQDMGWAPTYRSRKAVATRCPLTCAIISLTKLRVLCFQMD